MSIIDALKALRERSKAPVDITPKYTSAGLPIVAPPESTGGYWPAQNPNDIPPGYHWRDHENEYD